MTRFGRLLMSGVSAVMFAAIAFSFMATHPRSYSPIRHMPYWFPTDRPRQIAVFPVAKDGLFWETKDYPSCDLMIDNPHLGFMDILQNKVDAGEVFGPRK